MTTTASTLHALHQAAALEIVRLPSVLVAGGGGFDQKAGH